MKPMKLIHTCVRTHTHTHSPNKLVEGGCSGTSEVRLVKACFPSVVSLPSVTLLLFFVNVLHQIRELSIPGLLGLFIMKEYSILSMVFPSSINMVI